MIHWNNIIENLTGGQVVSVDPARWNMANTEYSDILKLWQDNNFNLDSIKWINFYDTKEVESQLCKQLNIVPLRSWISCLEPGYMTGPHYDIDDNEQEYLKHGKIQRYSIFISKPTVGQLFILNDEYHYNHPQGTIVKWNTYKDWHNGINGSLSNKYMFHLLGY